MITTSFRLRSATFGRQHVRAYGMVGILLVSGSGALRACTPGCAPVPAPAPATQSSGSSIPTEALDAANRERTAAGLAPLQLDDALQGAAATQAHDQANRATMSHDGNGGLAARVNAQGYAWSWLAENVAAGQRSPAEAMSAWMGSAPHRVNLLSPAAVHLGVDAAIAADGTWYWAMVLGAPG